MLKCNEIKYEEKQLAPRFSIHARLHLLVQEILDHTHLDLSIYGIGRHGSRLLFPRSRKKLMPKKKKINIYNGLHLFQVSCQCGIAIHPS